MEAVFGAAEVAPAGFRGTFVLKVKATGRQGGSLFLNSELDYRDQRCLMIALAPRTVDQLHRILGKLPGDGLLDQSILVCGTARRVEIGFNDQFGHLTDRYYYQTHVQIIDAEQISVLRLSPSNSAPWLN